MSVPKEKKTELITQYAQNEGDTGSVEVQVAVLTERIRNLTEHMRAHRKDVSTRRGLIGMVNKRSRLLRYLRKTSSKRYQSLIQSLGIRG